MSQNAYNRLRSQVDFLESLLAVLVIALLVLAISGAPDFAVITLTAIIGGGLLSLYRQHQLLERYSCPKCGESPHHRIDERAGVYHDPATANCLHCGERLTD